MQVSQQTLKNPSGRRLKNRFAPFGFFSCSKKDCCCSWPLPRKERSSKRFVADARLSCLCCPRPGISKDWGRLVARSRRHLYSPLSLQLWKSDDFGQTWIMIQEHVKSFSWYVSHLRVSPSSCLLSLLTYRPARPEGPGTEACSGPGPGPLLPLLGRDPAPRGCGTAG